MLRGPVLVIWPLKQQFVELVIANLAGPLGRPDPGLLHCATNCPSHGPVETLARSVFICPASQRGDNARMFGLAIVFIAISNMNSFPKVFGESTLIRLMREEDEGVKERAPHFLHRFLAAQ